MSGTSSGRRVLVLSHDVIKQNMAGPGIRSLELARVLARHCEVVLAMPNECDLAGETVRFHPYRHGEWERLRPAFEGVEVAFLTGFSLYEFPAIRALDIPLVVDLYDPFPLENLYSFAGCPTDTLARVHASDMAIVDKMCREGDFFVCANPRQRDWWLGVLEAKGRINPPTVQADPSLRQLIDEVPFGFPDRPFAATTPGPKTSHPALTGDDRLLLWGGGLWNWLDPVTLVRAMPAILREEPRARLLFPGTKHPNENVPEMERTREAIHEAQRLGLQDQSVFFGGWVPYEEWAAYLTDADVAISLHFDTPETQFSAVRSRVLGYIWARLPMVVTEGDTASRIVADHGLGEVVPYKDEAAVSAAILRVLAHGKAAYAPHFETVAHRYTWQRVAEPLVHFCAAPRRAPDLADDWQAAMAEAAATLPEAQKQAGERARVEELERQYHNLHEQVVAQAAAARHAQAEAETLRQQVAAYEAGRFLSLMRQIKRLRSHLPLP